LKSRPYDVEHQVVCFPARRPSSPKVAKQPPATRHDAHTTFFIREYRWRK
jgi:hypothetical protein